MHFEVGLIWTPTRVYMRVNKIKTLIQEPFVTFKPLREHAQTVNGNSAWVRPKTSKEVINKN